MIYASMPMTGHLLTNCSTLIGTAFQIETIGSSDFARLRLGFALQRDTRSLIASV